jgi:integrase
VSVHSLPSMSPSPRPRSKRLLTKRTLVPRPQSKAVRLARPDRAWAVSYRRADAKGRQVPARAFFSSKTEADAWCYEKRAEQVSLGNLASGLNDDIKREAMVCVSKLSPYGKTLTDAVAYYLRDLEMQGASKTVAQAVADLQDEAAARGLSDRHLRTINSVLGRFAQTYGAEVVANIRAEKVQAWLGACHSKDGKALSAVSFNTYRRYLALLFSFCVRRKWARENPVTDFEARKVRTKTPRLLSPGDLRQIIAAAGDDLRPALVLQAFCGLRVSEAAQTEWDDLLPSGHLQIGSNTSKTGRRRLAPIPKAALAYLVSVRQRAGAVYEMGAGADRVDALQKALTTLRDRVPQVRWGKNALRASALSYRLAETQDAARTALEMGNSPQVLLRDYRELATPEQARDWFAIDPARPQGKVLSLPRAKKRKAS